MSPAAEMANGCLRVGLSASFCAHTPTQVTKRNILTARDGSNGCAGGPDIERIHRWLDQIERGSRSNVIAYNRLSTR